MAADPEVRAALVAKQRELLAHGDWVAEGRDIGTVVAPDAELKVFLTADRARARAAARRASWAPTQATVLAEQRLRDERDSTREHSPLRAAPGAVDARHERARRGGGRRADRRARAARGRAR